MLVHVLEHERDIATGSAPSTFKKRIGLAVESRSSLRMLEIAEIVIVAVDDHGTVTNRARVKTIGRLSADGFSKAEGEETDPGHETEND